MKKKRAVNLVLALLVLGCVLAQVRTALAQEDESKAIKAEEFVKNRSTATANKTPSSARYKNVSKVSTSNTPPAGSALAQLGLTFWRFRRSTAADKTKELIEEEESGPTEWTLERIEEGTPLATGERVRLSIESLTRAGYLYVIDRELYADGSLGDPVLIYPTERTRDANLVKPGRLVYVPSATGKFRIKPSAGAKVHVGEIVTILVCPRRLMNHELLGSKSIRLPRQQVEAWEKLWSAPATRFEMDGGVGQIMTEKEQAAGERSQELTQADPLPQTVYRIAAKSDAPIMLSVPLKFRQ